MQNWYWPPPPSRLEQVVLSIPAKQILQPKHAKLAALVAALVAELEVEVREALGRRLISPPSAHT